MVSDIINENDISVQNDDSSPVRQKVCVIGAGAAGICAIRHLNMYLDRFEITCYEQAGDIGGTWNYTDYVGFDPDGIPIHTSMYKNLRTNLPMEIMVFPDYSANCKASYVHHSEVLKYLKQYCSHFNIWPYINFHHRIMYVSREDGHWNITVKDVKNDKEFTKTFDIVLICTGRYSVPSWPKYDTLKLFQGSVIHSHDYRIPEVYTGQRIAVIGGGLSGVDVAVEISKFGEEIIFINRNKRRFQNLPKNIRQINVEVLRFGPNTMIVRTQDGEEVSYEVDSIIMATGYHYNLRFTDPNCGVKMNLDGSIDGLYRHLINIQYPSMVLLAVSQRVLPLPLYHQQMLYYIKILMGEYKLPSKADMIRDSEEDYKYRLSIGLRPKDRHMMEVDMLKTYLDKLVVEANIKPLKPVILKLHRDLYPVRLTQFTTYKSINYRLISDDDYEEIREVQTNGIDKNNNNNFNGNHSE